MKKVEWIVGIGLLVLLGIQAVPVERTNPLTEGELAAPPAVSDVLRWSCYDCHSHQTRWPWYSRVAPVSWLLSHDVTEGRQSLNFSNWQALSPAKQAKAKREAWEEIESGAMPPWYYLPLHRDARLSAQDRSTLRAWLVGPDGNASEAR